MRRPNVGPAKMRSLFPRSSSSLTKVAKHYADQYVNAEYINVSLERNLTISIPLLHTNYMTTYLDTVGQQNRRCSL